MEFKHVPVLLDECINGLEIKKDGVYIDGTCGGAGHSAEIAKRLGNGILIGIDRDPNAVSAASERLKGYNAKVTQGNYSDMEMICAEFGITGADGILLDLGVSSHQLDSCERGFSYHGDAKLDMRMSQSGLSARDVLNGYTEEKLVRILFEYGEEKFARRIASGIVKERGKKEIETTAELAEIIKANIPAKFKRDKNPCKKTFQAVRIEVNREFEHLNKGLEASFKLLKSKGRLCVITFHSLEDRIVKQKFADFCRGCECPPDFPVCVCGKTPRAGAVTKKPVMPSEKELAGNARSRSAKLRIIEKI